MSPQTPTAMTLRWRLLWSLVFFGPAVFFAIERDYVAAAVCLTAGIVGFSGYRFGAISLLSSIVAIAAAITFAPSLGLAQEVRLEQWFGTTGLTNRLLSIALVGIAISMVVSILIMLVIGRAVRRRPGLQRIDRSAGFVLGIGQGAAVIGCLLGGLLIIEPIEQERAAQRDPNDARGQLISKFILGAASMTHESRLGPIIVEFNPFTRFPELNKIEEVQRTAQVLSDPGKIQQLLYHPSIQQLQQQPEVQRAVDQLNSDPEIRQILHSGQPMNRTMAMALMSHPAVLELMDQPGFLEQAASVIQNTSVMTNLAR